MKLRLKNFRCYEDKEFNFGDDGLTLISGGSGKGKSTIMLAIEFALFGTGTKLQTYGKRSCSVELEIDSDFKIFRQKAPNRLIVNDIYEDDAGEGIIKEKFGNNMLTCYIPQNIRKTFILMSPAERLDFLESLVSTGTDIQDIKSTAKSVAKKLCDEHNEAIGALKVSEKTLEAVKEPPKPRFHSKHSLKEQQTFVSKLTKRITDYDSTIEGLANDIENLKSMRNTMSVTEQLLKEKRTQLENLEEEMSSETTENNENNKYKGDANLSSLKDTLRSATLFTELQAQHLFNAKTIEEMSMSEKQSILQRIKDLENDIWVEFSEEEANEQLNLWKEEVARKKTKTSLSTELAKLGSVEFDLESATLRVEQLASSIDKLKKDIEIAEHPLFKCPHCRIDLRFTGKSLEYDADVLKTADVKSLKELLRKQQLELQTTNSAITTHSNVVKRAECLKKEIETVGDVDETAEESFNEISEYINRNKKNNDEYDKLQKSLEVPSKSVQLLVKKNEEIFGKMKKEKNVEDINALKKIISEQEGCKIIYDSQILKKKKLSEQITKVKAEISRLEKPLVELQKSTKSKLSLDEITSDILTKEKEVSDAKKEKSSDIKKVESYKSSIEYCKQLDVWKNLVNQRNTLVSREEDLRKRYAAACTFKEKILEAESIAITNMITTINTHAQFYLDHFFPDEPISVRLVAFKETKDVSKPQINLEIDYKGIDHDLTMLSGGELSRVILAFTLALAEIHHTPFVMLDESTSSLDQELTSSVVEGLKENFSGKLVLIIAHQVIQGVFDRVVRIE